MFSLYESGKSKIPVEGGILVENTNYLIEFDNPLDPEILTYIKNSSLASHIDWIKGNYLLKELYLKIHPMIQRLG